MERKRERSRNYLEEEKENLLTIIEQYNHIIENKKTDSVSSNMKSTTWNKIAELYNSTAKTGVRNGTQLKLLYENLRKAAKKHIADEKVEIYKTGGGSISSQMSSCDTRVLSLLGTRAEGHDNPYDSNADFQGTKVAAEKPMKEPQNLQQMHEPSASLATSSSSEPAVKRKAFFNSVKGKTKDISDYQREILKMKQQKHEKKMEILEIIKGREEYELQIKILEYETKKK